MPEADTATATVTDTAPSEFGQMLKQGMDEKTPIPLEAFAAAVQKQSQDYAGLSPLETAQKFIKRNPGKGLEQLHFEMADQDQPQDLEPSENLWTAARRSALRGAGGAAEFGANVVQDAAGLASWILPEAGADAQKVTAAVVPGLREFAKGEYAKAATMPPPSGFMAKLTAAVPEAIATYAPYALLPEEAAAEVSATKGVGLAGRLGTALRTQGPAALRTGAKMAGVEAVRASDQGPAAAMKAGAMGAALGAVGFPVAGKLLDAVAGSRVVPQVLREYTPAFVKRFLSGALPTYGLEQFNDKPQEEKLATSLAYGGMAVPGGPKKSAKTTEPPVKPAEAGTTGEAGGPGGPGAPAAAAPGAPGAPGTPPATPAVLSKKAQGALKTIVKDYAADPTKHVVTKRSIAGHEGVNDEVGGKILGELRRAGVLGDAGNGRGKVLPGHPAVQALLPQGFTAAPPAAPAATKPAAAGGVTAEEAAGFGDPNVAPVTPPAATAPTAESSTAADEMKQRVTDAAAGGGPVQVGDQAAFDIAMELAKGGVIPTAEFTDEGIKGAMGMKPDWPITDLVARGIVKPNPNGTFGFTDTILNHVEHAKQTTASLDAIGARVEAGRQALAYVKEQMAAGSPVTREDIQRKFKLGYGAAEYILKAANEPENPVEPAAATGEPGEDVAALRAKLAELEAKMKEAQGAGAPPTPPVTEPVTPPPAATEPVTPPPTPPVTEPVTPPPAATEPVTPPEPKPEEAAAGAEPRMSQLPRNVQEQIAGEALRSEGLRDTQEDIENAIKELISEDDKRTSSTREMLAKRAGPAGVAAYAQHVAKGAATFSTDTPLHTLPTAAREEIATQILKNHPDAVITPDSVAQTIAGITALEQSKPDKSFRDRILKMGGQAAVDLYDQHVANASGVDRATVDATVAARRDAQTAYDKITGWAEKLTRKGSGKTAERDTPADVLRGQNPAIAERFENFPEAVKTMTKEEADAAVAAFGAHVKAMNAVKRGPKAEEVAQPVAGAEPVTAAEPTTAPPEAPITKESADASANAALGHITATLKGRRGSISLAPEGNPNRLRAPGELEHDVFVAHLKNYGRYLLQEGTRKFEAWRDSMVQKFGEVIDPKLMMGVWQDVMRRGPGIPPATNVPGKPRMITLPSGEEIYPPQALEKLRAVPPGPKGETLPGAQKPGPEPTAPPPPRVGASGPQRPLQPFTSRLEGDPTTTEALRAGQVSTPPPAKLRLRSGQEVDFPAAGLPEDYKSGPLERTGSEVEARLAQDAAKRLGIPVEKVEGEPLGKGESLQQITRKRPIPLQTDFSRSPILRRPEGEEPPRVELPEGEMERRTAAVKAAREQRLRTEAKTKAEGSKRIRAREEAGKTLGTGLTPPAEIQRPAPLPEPIPEGAMKDAMVKEGIEAPEGRPTSTTDLLKLAGFKQRNIHRQFEGTDRPHLGGRRPEKLLPSEENPLQIQQEMPLSGLNAQEVATKSFKDGVIEVHTTPGDNAFWVMDEDGEPLRPSIVTDEFVAIKHFRDGRPPVAYHGAGLNELHSYLNNALQTEDPIPPSQAAASGFSGSPTVRMSKPVEEPGTPDELTQKRQRRLNILSPPPEMAGRKKLAQTAELLPTKAELNTVMTRIGERAEEQAVAPTTPTAEKSAANKKRLAEIARQNQEQRRQEVEGPPVEAMSPEQLKKREAALGSRKARAKEKAALTKIEEPKVPLPEKNAEALNVIAKTEADRKEAINRVIAARTLGMTPEERYAEPQPVPEAPKGRKFVTPPKESPFEVEKIGDKVKKEPGKVEKALGLYRVKVKGGGVTAEEAEGFGTEEPVDMSGFGEEGKVPEPDTGPAARAADAARKEAAKVIEEAGITIREINNGLFEIKRGSGRTEVTEKRAGLTAASNYAIELADRLLRERADAGYELPGVGTYRTTGDAKGRSTVMDPKTGRPKVNKKTGKDQVFTVPGKNYEFTPVPGGKSKTGVPHKGWMPNTRWNAIRGQSNPLAEMPRTAEPPAKPTANPQ